MRQSLELVAGRQWVKVITFLSLTKWSIFLSRCYCECSDCVWLESQKCRVSERLQLIMRVKWFKHLHSELNRKCDGDCELRKCGSTTLCGCFVGVCGCFWVFVGVRGVTICHYWLKHAPGTTWQGEKRKSAASSKMTVRQQLLWTKFSGISAEMIT